MNDLVEQVQFVVNADGEQQAVLLSISAWRDILARLEQLEDEQDAADLAAARAEDDELIPWGQVKSELQATRDV